MLHVATADTTPPEIDNAVRALGGYTIVAQTDTSNDHLQAIGFTKSLQTSVPDWNKLSAVRKIETVYFYAEAAEHGGGERALALLARNLALQYPTITSHDAIANLRAGDGPLHFTRPPPPPSPATISAAHRDAILHLASFVDSGSGLSAEWLMREAGITAEHIYDALRTATTVEHALTIGLGFAKPNERDTMIRKMVDLVAGFYPAVAHDARIASWRAPPQHPPPSTSPRRTSAPAWSALERTRLGVNETKSYRSWREGKRSLGGIVMGNDVIDHLPAKIASLDVRDGMTITLTTKRALTLPGVSPDDACVATKLAASDARGLIGLEWSALLLHTELLTIHPALIDTSIGGLLARTDAQLFSLPNHIAKLRASAPASVVERFAAAHRAEKDIKPRPSRIRLADRVITIASTGDTVLASSHGERVLFEFLLFDGDEVESPGAKKWTAALQPTLSVLLGDPKFRRVNDFVAAYALARAAKAVGTVMPACTPETVHTPDAIVNKQPFDAHAFGGRACMTKTRDPDLAILCGWYVACRLEAETVAKNGGSGSSAFNACFSDGFAAVCKGASATCAQTKRKALEALGDLFRAIWPAKPE